MVGLHGSAIVTVGDELLGGRVVDTNAAWLSRQLRFAGFPCVHRETVRDEIEEIAGSIQRARDRAAVVVVMGGLGPTGDDVTRLGMARALGVSLVRNPAALASIAELFESRGRKLPERDAVQAELPEGAGHLPNRIGTAPGVVWEDGTRLLFALPGVPVEMKALWKEGVAPFLEDHPAKGPHPVVAELTLSGIPESEVGEILGDLLRPGRNPSIGSYPRSADVVLSLEALGQSEGEAQSLIDRDIEEIEERLSGFVLCRERTTIQKVVAELLMQTGRTLAVAESLSGGRIADRIVDTPGVSAVFLGGVAAYANRAKIDLLQVRPATLEEHGAVSEACALEMALGVRSALGADIGISTTGIAGPGGATEGKAVGTVFLGFSTPERSFAKRLSLVGDREMIRERTAQRAFDLLWRELR